MAIASTIETPTKFARYSVADGIAIPLNTLLKMSGADLFVTASTSVGAGEVFAGIAWEEKTADDGLTEISTAVNGVHDLTNSGSAVVLGSLVSLSGANLIRQAVDADMALGLVVGRALETGAADEVIRVRVGDFV